ncbi:hypothetical protein RCL_jg21661.t1 [Rhizophagus clarus]|uniref:DDE-1 domain-containing protein n=1 Tax=Rhizophagus clarus TaxID=94130 RepID=A0A8H3L263_9GLOM|nr:hypothetical protein RCL_jg21661.t1 [Rhizophagus clarus]
MYKKHISFVVTIIFLNFIVPDSDLKLNQYYTNRNFPAWWQGFKKDWNKVMKTNIESAHRHDYLLIFFGDGANKIPSICQENDLWEREKDNIHFVKSFDSLIKPVVKAVEECEKKLVARIQQSTWSSKSGRLAFWLR